MPATGRVTLVGAGPGDPDLLTVKALRLLQTADVVLYDTLVSAQVLALVGAGVERLHVGKTGYGDTRPQDEINARMVALALAGRHVIRLKSGDPLIFAAPATRSRPVGSPEWRSKWCQELLRPKARRRALGCR